MQTTLRFLPAVFGGAALLLCAPLAEAAKKPKYYFSIVEVKSTSADDVTKVAARQLLEKELASRPEFTPDLGGAKEPEAVADELRRRKLQGFQVTLDIQSLKQDSKPPRAGGRLPQLAVSVRVSVFGTTIPEAKLAFGGDGEATIEAEVVERRKDEEADALTKDVLAQAIKQAVDQAVAKLSMPKSKPFNETKKRRKLT